MKVLTKNSVYSVLKVGFITSLLAGFMLMGVDLFKNLDTYTRYQVGGLKILELTFLYFPSGILLGMGPAFLFSVTYFLSMLHASNEFICILNSGINYKKFLIPIICSAIFVSVFFFGFNELVALPTGNIRDAQMRIITSTENGNKDNSNVAINNEDNSMLIYADKYVDDRSSLYGVTLLEKDDSGKLKYRTNAHSATWDEEKNYWLLNSVYVYAPSGTGHNVDIQYYSKLDKRNFTLSPELFKNLSTEISKMSIPLASSYLKKIKYFNRTQYSVLGTDYYKRLLGCLTPFIMIIIACSMNYRFKKNVLFFSLLCSICIAVIYYVIQMLTLLLANQGIIHPSLGMLIPFISIIGITVVFSLALRG